MRSLMLCFFLFSSLFSVGQENFTVSFLLKTNQSLNSKLIDINILNVDQLPNEVKNNQIIFNNIPKGNYQAAIQGEGFASKIISFSVDNHTEVVVDLDPSYKNLGDVTVSANKRDLNLQLVPGSITSLSAKQIKDMRIWEMSDLSGVAPNFYLANSGDNRNVTAIRGITTTSYEQAVVTYIDGVAQFNLDTYIPQLNNIDHIEIIRGAQGTLYGRNAMGGIINITTKKPVNKTTGYADVQLGNYGQQRYSAGFNTTLIKNKMFTSVSIMHDKRDGFYINTLFDQKYDKQQQTMLDVQLRYYFKNNWSILANHKQYIGRNNGAFPLVNDLKELFESPYTLAQNQLAEMRDQSSNSSISIKHRAKQFDISWQTAYQRNYRYYDKTLDADFSPADIVGIFNNYGNKFNTVEILSNELRLQSAKSSVDSKIEWTAGLYQFMQKNPGRQATVFGTDAGFIGVPDVNFSLISNNTAKNNGVAAYASIGYKLSKQLLLTGGIRLDNENRSMSVSGEYEKQPMQPIVTQEIKTATTNYTAFSPKIGIQFINKDRNQIYANYARGFRSGGLSGISSDPSQLPLSPYLPEFSNMFEIGTKGGNKKQTIRYSFAAFYNLVNNIQTPLLILPDAVTVTQNAGKLRSFGVEFEMIAQIAKGLSVQYNRGITDAKYNKLNGVSNGEQIDLSGKKQVFTPSYNQFIALQYEIKLSKNMLSIRSEYQRNGKQYFDLANTIVQNEYGILNLRSSFRTKQFELSIWARNLTGTKYIDYAYDFGAAHLGRPRTWGMGLNYRFN
jgi:iron complex outermembrane receptor protein